MAGKHSLRFERAGLGMQTEARLISDSSQIASLDPDDCNVSEGELVEHREVMNRSDAAS